MSIFEEVLDQEAKFPEFYYFEPWDVEERSQELLDRARADGVDLHSPEYVNVIGRDPKPFQTGIFLDEVYFQVNLAANQIGKSYPHLIDAIIRLTHEVPISLRYDKGVRTTVKRFCDFSDTKSSHASLLNVHRFGRFNKATGELIDRPKVDLIKGLVLGDELKVEWDCGFIEGVGVYPETKFAKPGSMIWICTTAKAWEFFWWPRFAKKEKRIIPEHLIDTRKGVGGFSSRDNIIYLTNGCEIKGISYEMGYSRVEAEKVHRAIIDEEPDDERFMAGLRTHAHSIGMAMTPYRGLTWTRPLIFENPSPEKKIYHATAYDSPYQTEQSIKQARMDAKSWDVKARIYGLPAEQTGMPYYDREKIQSWIDKFIPTHKGMRLEPSEHYHSIDELMQTPIMATDAFEVDERDVWEIYEEPEPQYAYWMGVDWGKGTKDPAEAVKQGRSNRNAACIYREPDPLKKEKDPVMVANLRSTLETVDFARVCMYGCRWYNNAVFAPECRGFDAGSGIATTRDYPFFYKMTVTSDATRKTKETLGFDTNARTRQILFDLVGEWIKARPSDEAPDIPHLATLKELAGCVVGKKGRPDHATNGTLDSVIPMGICLYVFTHAREQITNNGEFSLDNSGEKSERYPSFKETRPILGSKRGLDERNCDKKFGRGYVSKMKNRSYRL